MTLMHAALIALGIAAIFFAGAAAGFVAAVAAGESRRRRRNGSGRDPLDFTTAFSRLSD